MIERIVVEQIVIEYLANALWQIPLLAAGAWLLLTAAKPAPRMQHAVWLAVLAAAVVLPLHGMAWSGPIVVRPASIAVNSREQLANASLDLAAGSTESPIAANTSTRQSALASIEATVRPHKLVVSQATARWMVELYAGVMMFGLYRIVRAWREARRLVAGSQKISLAGEQTVVLEDYGRRLRIRLPEVHESVEISSPMIVGATFPVLLLPERFATHAHEEIKAALLHELAHVKRRDYLVNAICQLAALPVVWHPATHWVQGRVRRTREMVCDRMAAQEMRSEVGYARCLLTLAKGMLQEPAFETHSAGIGLFSNNALEERVMRLMETKTAMRARTKRVRVLSGVTAMAVATAMTIIFHVEPTMAASNPAPHQTELATIQTPATPPTPAASPVPAAAPSPATPPTPPAPPAAPKHPRATPANHQDADNWNTIDGDSFVIVNGERRPLTPEEKRRVDQEMARATREIAAAKAKLNSPEFKKQIADAQAQAAKAREYVNSPAFKKQIADAQAQATKARNLVNSPEFKKQIADAQAQATKAREYVNSPEFKKQMDEVLKKNENLKLEMPKIQIDVQKAIAQIDTPEFRRQMQQVQTIDLGDMQKIIDDDLLKLNESLHENITIK
jgi:beta-lactamase regulating signal transducer with metallopeptidase domain